jgi:hypothetical protein
METSPIETVYASHNDFDLLPTGVPMCRPSGLKPNFGYSHLVLDWCCSGLALFWTRAGERSVWIQMRRSHS